MSTEALPDTRLQYLVGTLPDGRVVLDFQTAKVDHVKLTREQALELAEGLVEAVRQAKNGAIMLPGDSVFLD